MNTLWLRIVDAHFRPIRGASVRALTADQRPFKLNFENDRWVGRGMPGQRLVVEVAAQGYETETHSFDLRDELTQVVVGLRQPGQFSYSQGLDRLAFVPVEEAFLLRIGGKNAADVFAKLAKGQKLNWRPVSDKAGSASDDLFVHVEGDAEKAQSLAKELSAAKHNAEISRVIGHGERPAFGLNNELIVRFRDDVRRPEADRLAAGVGLRILRELRHAGNAFVLGREGFPSYDLLKAADALARSGRVVYAEPNLTFAIEADQYTPNDPLWEQVPHLQLIRADHAWDLLDNVDVNLRGGSPNITIGVIDPHGVAPNHQELTANLTDGTSKLVASINFTASPIAAQTVAGLGGDHGTQCAASATAAFDDNRGMPGVAPNCRLIGARIGGVANSVFMADIYLWVGGFLNGSTAAGFPAAPPARPADVISSSFGVNGMALSNTIRDCFDFLTTYGRGGRGCVLLFSLGNNGYVDFTNAAGGAFRAWPTYQKTLGVGSSINVNPTNPIPVSFHADPNGNTNNIATAVDTRTLFSPFGATALRKPDLVSPSHTAYNAAGNLIDPILSAVRVGTGNVDGCPGPATCNDYAVSFGGTSHSTPTVAGAVALILSARPNLSWVQVRDILRQSCARIDAAQANAIGQWQDLDGDGLIDYSRWYGAGRLNVEAAVGLALDESLPLADVYVRENLADTGDVPSGGSWWASPDIWVRQEAGTPIPALAWNDAPPHQNARRGQDNALFCRVRNRGTAAASSVYVRAMLTHWAGLEFVYPADFQPSNNVGAPVPNPLVPGTYLIGEARIDNLGVGADQIVKFIWPQALIPPATVMVGGATVHWHPCLLVEASPHDGPEPIGGLAVPVQGNNNIAQRNISIVDAADANADLFVGMIAGTRSAFGVATLILDATLLRGASSIRLHLADERAMRQLTAGIRQAVDEQRVPVRTGEDGERCAVIIEQRTRVRVECGPCDTVIEVAPGSRIFTCGTRPAEPVKVNFVKHQNLEAVELIGLRGQIEIPLRLAGNQFVPLLVAVTGPANGDLHLAQRRGDGEISAGYGIRRTLS
ncbi:S8 family serine peptidase [Geoalkalibacter halelectricus]|uniref:S8 family serine peptidase n=1 Tax=Geoalkalibacter halelectricus TaxID=2847045 RepID=UPI003D257DDA